jgi:hypothetical protein
MIGEMIFAVVLSGLQTTTAPQPIYNATFQMVPVSMTVIGPQWPTNVSVVPGQTWYADNPQPNRTYFFAGISGWRDEVGGVRTLVPCDGDIVLAQFDIVANGPGSDEPSSVFIVVNGSTQYIVSDTVKVDVMDAVATSPDTFRAPVKFKDSVWFKWQTPAWAKPPTDMRIKHSIGVRCN